jgi:hypothetical protein
MQPVKISFFLCLLLSSLAPYSSLSQETPTANEIIQWLNNFEDSNSPEAIMEGTFEDKVNLHYQDSTLTINSMFFGSISGPSSRIREVFLIKDIKQIEAFPRVKGDFTIVDIYIRFDPGKIKLECKKYEEVYFTECEFCTFRFEKYGYTSMALRFKFPNSKSEEYTQKVYNALEKLAKMHGANPKIGSIF